MTVKGEGEGNPNPNVKSAARTAMKESPLVRVRVIGLGVAHRDAGEPIG